MTFSSSLAMRLRHQQQQQQQQHRVGVSIMPMNIKTNGYRRCCSKCLWLLLLPVVVALLVYSNSLNGQFVHDDLSAITTNADVTGISIRHSPPHRQHWTDFLYNDFWGTNMMDPSSHKSYRPLTIITFKYVIIKHRQQQNTTTFNFNNCSYN